MNEKRNSEKRAGAADRRFRKMDRRQFVDIGWTLDNERRNAPKDRREGPEDRRVNN
jgi:hypothetical protein